MTGALTVLPLYRNVTMVPHGRVRCATPTRSLVSVCPQAVPLPYRPGPYQLMLGSKRQSFFSIEPRGAAGWRTFGRVVTATGAPGSTNAEPGPTLEGEPVALTWSSVVDAEAGPARRP